ncbi:MAG TPA: tetratricopeptide repeat protein, partial [Anaerolineales bacterium]|nr:tetratricopeptide repeat protein [Anaerolineales bacterium]
NNTKNTKIIITNPFVPILKDGEEFLEAGTWAMTLDGLDNASAVAFLRAYGLDDLSEDKLAPLVREINGHPFILNHIAHYIQTMGVSAALENLQGDLEEVHELFGDSLKERLSSQEFNALQSLTILNREMRLNGMCQVAQVKPSIIMRLREKGLLQTNDTGYFWLHNIVRNSIRPTEPNVIKQAHSRAMDFYRRQDMPASHQGIDDYANVLEWQHHAVEAGDVISAYSALYSTGLADQLMSWNEYDLLSSLCEQTLSTIYQVEANLEQVQANLSNIERIKIYHTVGVACFLLGDFQKSITHLKSALNLLQSEEDEKLRIRLLIDLSESYNGNRDFKSAMDLCQQIVALLTTTKDDALQAKFLHLRGIIHRDRGELEEAVRDLEAGLKLYEGLNDYVHRANITGDLGIVYYSQNQFAKALISHRHAVALYQGSGDSRGVMIGHFNMGDILLLDEQYKLALKEFQTALDLARKKKIVWMELDAGLYLIESHIALSQFDKAEKELNLLQPIITRRPSSCRLGFVSFLRACLSWQGNRLDEAREYFQKALELLENKGCEYDRARVYIKYAKFMKEQRQIDGAKETLEKGRKVFADLNNQLGIQVIERNFGRL